MSSAIDGFMKTREKYQSDSKISNILNGNQKREQRVIRSNEAILAGVLASA